MRIQELSGKNICILGYGKEGKAMVEALEKYTTGFRITIADKNEVVGSKKYEVRTGENYLKNLSDFDVIIKSPGIPPHLLTPYSSLLTTSTQIFLDTIRDSGSLVIGVTGSKGKSTTASLIYHILSSSHKSQVTSFLVGNIGEPSIAHIADAKAKTIFVVEMSSYQLMDLTVSPEIAVVTSFFPEHLDYHSTRPELCRMDSLMASHVKEYTPLENYLEAKKHIARFQKKSDHIYYNARFANCKEIADESAGSKHPFSDVDAPVLIEETKLKGTHNLSNIAAAFLVCEQLGVPLETAIDAIKSFTPLPHRLESLGIIDDIEWVNDSISTTPQSAIAALDALGNRVETIILGGQDRGYDFTPLVNRLQSSSVNTVILLPDSGRKIGAIIREAKLEVACFDVKDMKEAVAKVTSHKSQVTSRNSKIPIVLLSPASPSYGHFKNFEDRGEQFKKYIESAPRKGLL